MTVASTILLGLPVPSRDPVFLGIVAVHVVFGVTAVLAGALAMLSPKGRGRHSSAGTIYFWSLTGLFVTMSVLSFLRWYEDWPLFVLGALAFSAALIGRACIRRRRPRMHLAGMAASYIVMLTAFYVDNGKNLPLWRELPEIAFWILPSAIGIPLAVYFLVRLPRFAYGPGNSARR